MKPVYQTILHAPEGNCFAACVASILEMPLEDVPNFCAVEPHHNWLAHLLDWLTPKGLSPVLLSPWERVINDMSSPIAGYCILGVRTDPPTSEEHPEWLHAVVGHAELTSTNHVVFSVVHDPNPKPRRIVEFIDALWIVRNAGAPSSAGLSRRKEEVMSDETYMVFDVESLGLHGEGFSVGYVVIVNRIEVESGYFHTSPEYVAGTKEDFRWANVYTIPAMRTIPSCTYGDRMGLRDPQTVRSYFWHRWDFWKMRGAVLAADCPWPVEAKFLIECVNDVPFERRGHGPYPLIDVASVRLAAGLDPLGTEDRREGELPEHHPLADARQSARLLIEALESIHQKASHS